MGATSLPEGHLQVSGFSSQAQGIAAPARDPDNYMSSTLLALGEHWEVSGLLGWNRSAMGQKGVFVHRGSTCGGFTAILPSIS